MSRDSHGTDRGYPEDRQADRLPLTARERVELERHELVERLAIARSFRDRPLFGGLSPAAKALFHVQVNAMATYHAALVGRLDVWEELA